MEDIILVTGCDRTRSWTNIAFLGGGDDAEASFGERVFHGPDNSIDIQFSTEHAIEAVLNLGPEGRVRSCDICRIDGYEMTLRHDMLIRTYPKINAYLSEGFVSLVPSGSFQGV